MQALTSCGWCHHLVNVTDGPAPCPRCGHTAGVSRLECRCPRCCGAAGPVRYCALCRHNEVNAEGGFDVCAECLNRQ